MKTLKQFIIDLQKFAEENDAMDLPCVTDNDDRFDYDSFDGPRLVNLSGGYDGYNDFDKDEYVRGKGKVVVF